MNNRLFSYVAAVLLATLFSSTVSAEKQVIAGAGPSTKVVQLFVDKFGSESAAAGYTFEVPPRSAKHAGGIKASSTFIFGRTGRPLNDKEKGMQKGEIFLARIPIAFATGARTNISALSMSQVEDLYSGKSSNWSNVGGSDSSVVLVGREPTEALFTVLKAAYPSFNDAKFNKVLKKDHQVVKFLQSPDGANAIAFGALSNFSDVNVVKIDDFSAGVSVGLVYDLKNKDHPLVAAAQAFASTQAWADAVKTAGLLPPQ